MTTLHDAQAEVEPSLDELMKLADRYAGSCSQVTLDKFVNKIDTGLAECRHMENYLALKSAIAAQLQALTAERDALRAVLERYVRQDEIAGVIENDLYRRGRAALSASSTQKENP